MSHPLSKIIEEAFHYRGDVTLDLTDGRQVEGYLFGRNHDAEQVQLFLKGEPNPSLFAYSQISSLRITGEDTAAGKSWEAWKAKKATPHAE